MLPIDSISIPASTTSVHRLQKTLTCAPLIGRCAQLDAPREVAECLVAPAEPRADCPPQPISTLKRRIGTTRFVRRGGANQRVFGGLEVSALELGAPEAIVADAETRLE